VFGRIASRDERFEMLDEQRDSLQTIGKEASVQPDTFLLAVKESQGETVRCGRPAYLFEFLSARLISRTHLDNKCHTRQEDAVIPVLKERLGFAGEVVDEIGNTSDNSKGTQSGLRCSEGIGSMPAEPSKSVRHRRPLSPPRIPGIIA
jgi:hypothetical protein